MYSNRSFSSTLATPTVMDTFEQINSKVSLVNGAVNQLTSKFNDKMIGVDKAEMFSSAMNDLRNALSDLKECSSQFKQSSAVLKDAIQLNISERNKQHEKFCKALEMITNRLHSLESNCCASLSYRQMPAISHHTPLHNPTMFPNSIIHANPQCANHDGAKHLIQTPRHNGLIHQAPGMFGYPQMSDQPTQPKLHPPKQPPMFFRDGANTSLNVNQSQSKPSTKTYNQISIKKHESSEPISASRDTSKESFCEEHQQMMNSGCGDWSSTFSSNGKSYAKSLIPSDLKSLFPASSNLKCNSENVNACASNHFVDVGDRSKRTYRYKEKSETVDTVEMKVDGVQVNIISLFSPSDNTSVIDGHICFDKNKQRISVKSRDGLTDLHRVELNNVLIILEEQTQNVIGLHTGRMTITLQFRDNEDFKVYSHLIKRNWKKDLLSSVSNK